MKKAETIETVKGILASQTGYADLLVKPGTRIGRYVLHDVLGTGGMATVHIGRLIGPAGFSRTVAIKHLHPHLVLEKEFAKTLLDEGRIVSRIRHPNVVAVIDVVSEGDDLLLVLEYIAGESLAHLLGMASESKTDLPLPIVSAIACDVLRGLHAAHEATSETGSALSIVHRDVSPQNVIIGDDGISRVLDFGIAKAAGRLHTTKDGNVKGKLAYMAPEQVRAEGVSRRTDIYALGVVLWEMLTRKQLFASKDEGVMLEQVLVGTTEPPSRHRPDVPEELDAIVLRALDARSDKRFETAREMADAIQAAVRPALAVEVAAWLEGLASPVLKKRAARVAAIESMTSDPIEPRKKSRAPWILLPFVAIALFGYVLFRMRIAAEASAPPPPTPIGTASSMSVPAAPPPTESSGPIPTPRPTIISAVKASAEKHAAPSATPAIDCTIPYTVDSTGARIYRRECL